MSQILISNVQIIDGALEAPSDPVNILIENDRIKEISKTAVSDGNSVHIDGAGRFALPGLIDCHVHPFLAETNLAHLRDVPPTLMTARATNILRKMLLRGFTTVRDASGADWGIKKAVEDGEIIGPRMFIAGRALTQTGGHADFRSMTEEASPCQCSSALSFIGRVADGRDEVRKAVREELRLGADQIKIMVSGGVSSSNDKLERSQYSPEEIRVIVAEAERHGTYVMAHAYGADAIKMALEAGVRTIEHGNLIDESAAVIAAEKGAFVVPTLVTYDVLNKTGAESGWDDKMLTKLRTVRAAGLRSIEICKAAGVKLGFGTDLLGDSFDNQSREFLIRSEIETPREIINSATRINAEILQKTGELGEISVGAIADILIVDGNPLQDLQFLQGEGKHLSLIMKAGKIYKNLLN